MQNVQNMPKLHNDSLTYDCSASNNFLDDAVNCADNLIAEDGSLAMRITQEPFSKELCYNFRSPIVSTSANVSGEPAASNYCDISEEILNAVDYVCWTRRQGTIHTLQAQSLNWVEVRRSYYHKKIKA